MVAYKTGPCNEDKMQQYSATGFSTEAAKRQSKWYLQHTKIRRCHTHRSMIPSICLRTSCALFSVRTCTKFS